MHLYLYENRLAFVRMSASVGTTCTRSRSCERARERYMRQCASGARVARELHRSGTCPAQDLQRLTDARPERLQQRSNRKKAQSAIRRRVYTSARLSPRSWPGLVCRILRLGAISVPFSMSIYLSLSLSFSLHSLSVSLLSLLSLSSQPRHRRKMLPSEPLHRRKMLPSQPRQPPHWRDAPLALVWDAVAPTPPVVCRGSGPTQRLRRAGRGIVRVVVGYRRP